MVRMVVVFAHLRRRRHVSTPQVQRGGRLQRPSRPIQNLQYGGNRFCRRVPVTLFFSPSNTALVVFFFFLNLQTAMLIDLYRELLRTISCDLLLLFFSYSYESEEEEKISDLTSFAVFRLHLLVDRNSPLHFISRSSSN